MKATQTDRYTCSSGAEVALSHSKAESAAVTLCDYGIWWPATAVTNRAGGGKPIQCSEQFIHVAASRSSTFLSFIWGSRFCTDCQRSGQTSSCTQHIKGARRQRCYDQFELLIAVRTALQSGTRNPLASNHGSHFRLPYTALAGEPVAV